MRILRLFALLFSFLLLLALAGVGGLAALLWKYGQDVPDYHQLAHYQPPVTTRLYAGDGRLLMEYAQEKRSFVPIGAVPERVINAFLAAEDKNFYTHAGIDYMGVMRAVVLNVKNRLSGHDRRPMGASTITQQVAKNFLLGNEASLRRKIREAILAYRIEQTFSKQKILELYLNEIYLGQGNYGIAAAALSYFNKSLDELTIAEAAVLASLPKAPNNYNPVRFPQAAKDRRDWVIGRMVEDGFIPPGEGTIARMEPLTTHPNDNAAKAGGGEYFAEEIRRQLVADYGEPVLYRGGLSVRSTLDTGLQAIATRTLRDGLVAYDRRHGWRGPVTHLNDPTVWKQYLASPNGQRPDLAPWLVAVVLGMNDTSVDIGVPGGHGGKIPMAELRWARPVQPDKSIGPAPRKPSDILKVGDVIPVEAISKPEDGKGSYPPGTYTLRQAPKVEGALVAMDPHTGRVLAMQGGFSYARSQFNRATQALRQPGSSFKPFVYLTALENGYTPSSKVLDGPIELDQGPGLPKWKPSNYHNDFLGPTTLRVGMEKSRNLMTVRLAATLGMEKISTLVEHFGVMDKLPRELSMALGAGETTPLRMATAYAQIVNGGRKVTATLIDRIQDRDGKTVYRHDQRKCDLCSATFYTDQDMPDLPDAREQLVDPMSAYQMVHILEGVVERGTGKAVLAVGKPLAGKTGTSNNSKDTWFVGFSPDLVVAVFVGFDDPVDMGGKETGGSVAAPIFRDFMMEALKDKPATPFRQPPGIRLVRVNAATGHPAEAGENNVIWEAFKPDTVPAGGEEMVLDTVEGSSLDLNYGALGGAAEGSGPLQPDIPTGEGDGTVPMLPGRMPPAAGEGSGAPALSPPGQPAPPGAGAGALPAGPGAATAPGTPGASAPSGLPAAPVPATPQAGGLY